MFDQSIPGFICLGSIMLSRNNKLFFPHFSSEARLRGSWGDTAGQRRMGRSAFYGGCLLLVLLLLAPGNGLETTELFPLPSEDSASDFTDGALRRVVRF